MSSRSLPLLWGSPWPSGRSSLTPLLKGLDATASELIDTKKKPTSGEQHAATAKAAVKKVSAGAPLIVVLLIVVLL